MLRARLISPFAAALAVFALLFAPLIAEAQERPPGQKIPELYLNTDKGQCIAGCIENNEANVCEIVCQCTIDRFRVEMDLEAYRRLKGQMETGTMTAETRVLLDTIGQFCADELERQLAETGAPEGT